MSCYDEEAPAPALIQQPQQQQHYLDCNILTYPYTPPYSCRNNPYTGRAISETATAQPNQIMPSSQTPLLARHDTSSLRSSNSSTSLSSLAQNHKSSSKQREIQRYVAFSSAIISCLCAGSITTYSLYGHLFQERLRYTQVQVNIVIIAAEMALYLPVSLLGYLCDRIGPAPLSLMSSVLFGIGYLLAAFTYRSGAKDVMGYTQERGWPLWVMVVAFVIIGLGTTCMYLSAVTTCAKNFGKGKYRGLALACPIAAFGLSGVWQSQLGSRVLYERRLDGKRGDVDVFKYFVFLAVALVAVGLLGTFLLKIVDEDELIDEAVDELERSGLLEDSEFFRRTAERNYGSIEDSCDDDATEARRILDAKAIEDEEARKKTWLLNEETRMFLKDRTMWYFAAGFFFVSGPGETFLTNLGTIIGTLYPPPSGTTAIPTSAATHVSIVAITSTVARIIFGTLTDVFAPASVGQHYGSISNSLSSLPTTPRRFTISRVAFLVLTGLLLSLGQVVLASGAVQNHAERFWLVSSLIGIGYGAIFSLTPLIITVVWGVENFGTNWGIVAMFPAFGATVWGLVYSHVYQWAAKHRPYSEEREEDILCYGKSCYAGSFWAMAVSVWIGCALWVWAWKGRGGWSKRGIAV
ncbi:putative MCH1 Monocarboxylate Permease-like protein [Venustampulla echinocandica]|uniref:Probable transporter MCH1 n=1 Tax=Venustampulla echinocandica TaxID=2656787 RepID=A0A370TLW9_9HELO|nr:putative MCH1 Monocarboxylate Permease-like protein [Venustampulla echinocandica]RDL36507.1 putative MCH1 Monocarboxylate Permease-like protein [Venustampulla echinocandica]